MTIQEDKNKTTGFSEIQFKYAGPKWDAHTHLYGIDDTIEFVRIAEHYNINKFTAIVRDDWIQYEEKLPEKFVYARFINSENLFKKDVSAVLDDLQLIADKGFSIAKFWYAPRWRKYVEDQWKVQAKGFRIDDPKLKLIYTKIEDLGLILLIHVADPDIFYTTKYQPESLYGSKQQHLKELENILANHPNMKIQVAHFAGQPEHLDQLGKWFDSYSNLIIDTSSAKWMARDFSYQTEAAREFFIQYQDRILFGTDIVSGRTDREPIPGYYYVRYLSLQALLETDVVNLPLPIEDLENNNKTVINGLDLSEKVLKKIYWENSRKFYRQK